MMGTTNTPAVCRRSPRVLLIWGMSVYGRCADFCTRRRRLIAILGWLLVASWFAVTVVSKIAFYRAGVSVNDIFLFANAFANTHFPDKLLYTATYDYWRGIHSLLWDHNVLTSLLLVPFYKLFDSPLFLIVLQALAPAGLVLGLVIVARRLGGDSLPGLAVALLTLFNPTFTNSVLDPVGGFRLDAQFLLYFPAFITCFLLRRPVATMVFLLLFLGIKENAAFYGMAFGALVTTLGIPLGSYRRLGLAVLLLSAAYFVLAVFFIPRWAGVPNLYVHWGVSHIGRGMLAGAADGFFRQKWYEFYLYFIYAIGSLPFYLATLPDVGMYSVLERSSSVYYDFTCIVMLSFGTLAALLRLHAAGESGFAGLARRLFKVAIAAQLAIAIPWTGWQFVHDWHKSMLAAVHVPAADKEAAWNMVDLNCGVCPHDAILDRFYKLPYWLRTDLPQVARYLVTIDPASLSAVALERDPLTPFLAANRDRLRLVGRAGPLTVWLNPSVPCRSWGK